MADAISLIPLPFPPEPPGKKVRFEARLTQENYDFLFQMSRADGRDMGPMVNEILRRLRLGSNNPQPSAKEKAPDAIHA